MECSSSNGFPDEIAVASVADRAEAAAHELRDERSLPFDALPHVGVERLLREEPDDPDFRVLVALLQDTTLTLGDVAGPPRTVQVIQRDGTVLDVGASAHILRGTHQHRDTLGTRSSERAGLSSARSSPSADFSTSKWSTEP